ncbi:plasmid recombination enzyme, partial [Staphylococcus epidermidis]
TGKRKIRKDAVKHIDGMITSDNEFFSNQTPADTKQFFEHAKEFLEQEYGKDNLLYATVHMDERTPHMHFGIVPITEDGRMSAKDVVGNKKALTGFQDRFNEYVNKRGYDLERGTSRQLTNRTHDQVNRYKQKTEYHKQEYERESQKLAHLKQQNRELINDYQKSLETLRKPLNVPYEVETEKVGGLFNKELQETGNVVISKDEFNQFQEQIKAAQRIMEDYEYIKSGSALEDKDKKINEQDDLLNKAVERIENADDNFNRLYEMAKPLKENIEIALRLLKILLKELEQVLGRNTFAERVNKLTEDEPKLNGLAVHLDKQMNPELYPEREQEQQQEQNKNQKRDRSMHL